MLKIKVSGEHVQVDEMHIPASVILGDLIGKDERDCVKKYRRLRGHFHVL